MNHYTYCLTVDNFFYWGVRSCSCSPEKDINYMSSSKLVQAMRLRGIQFKKEIVNTFNSRKEAEIGEQELFDLTDIEDVNCLNLNSHKQPYYPMRAAIKIEHVKKTFPKMQYTRTDIRDNFNIITPNDLKYRITNYKNVWTFVDHPDKLRQYWPTTGTLSYEPGRSDLLMTRKANGELKHYITDMSNIIGSEYEWAKELLTNHMITGQKTPVMQFVLDVVELFEGEELKEIFHLFINNIGDNRAWLVNKFYDETKSKLKKLYTTDEFKIITNELKSLE